MKMLVQIKTKKEKIKCTFTKKKKDIMLTTYYPDILKMSGNRKFIYERV